MAATPRMQRLSREVMGAYPDASSFGVYNPRHIQSKWWLPWSQHAAAEPSRGWFGNAWDITSPLEIASRPGGRSRSNPDHMDYLNRIHTFLYQKRDELHINELLWNRPDHYDHIHVSTWPKMADEYWRTHPTRGGPVITIGQDGTRRDTYQIYDLEGEMIIELGDRGGHVARIQRWINNAPKPPTPPLVDDGIFGPATESAVRDYQANRKLDDTGIVDGITYADLTLFKRGIPG